MKYRKLIIASLASFFLATMVLASSAQGLKDAFSDSTEKPLGNIANKSGYDVAGGNSLEGQISLVISVLLEFLGIIFLVLIIYAGYLWMTAQGDKAKVDKSKDIMERAAIGLIIVVTAFTLSTYIVSKFAASTLKDIGS